MPDQAKRSTARSTAEADVGEGILGRLASRDRTVEVPVELVVDGHLRSVSDASGRRQGLIDKRSWLEFSAAPPCLCRVHFCPTVDTRRLELCRVYFPGDIATTSGRGGRGNRPSQVPAADSLLLRRRQPTSRYLPPATLAQSP